MATSHVPSPCPWRALPWALILGAGALLAPSQAVAQADSIVVITGRGLDTAGVAGFADMPLSRSPLQASVFGSAQLGDAGVTTIGGLTRLDASLGDAYNADGYWSILSSRGYTLDNRFNYRRDGLPINAETAIALDNKDRLELLKGSSGIQAGTSAPGGLVNLVVKRPAGRIRTALVEAREPGSLGGTVDLGDRFGSDGAIGLRLNLATEKLEGQARPARGSRWLAALAADWQLGPDSLLQAEVESSHQEQPSAAGFSLLGNQVPDAATVDPRLNLNAQPWVQPVVLNGDTASLRWQQKLRAMGEGWRVTAHAMTQRLKSDDRTAFPYGVYDANYICNLYCDRFAPDGSFTYWEYISDNERRTTDALALTLAGRLGTGAIQHQFETGVQRSRHRGRFEDQVFDIAGPGRIDGSLQSPPSMGLRDANTERDERSTEWFARDAMRLGPVWQLWAGVRHTTLHRSSIRTSPDSDGGLRATHYERQATTPWVAAAAQLSGSSMVYASWGRGLEVDVAPNRPLYRNAGASLALDSRQREVGVKHHTETLEGAVTLFDIDRGQAADIGACNVADSCERRIDGSARHRGVEADVNLKKAEWSWQASLMLLAAERRGSTKAGVDGQRPVNVPEATLRLGTEYRPRALPGLALMAHLSAESNRRVLPHDASVRIPGWQRLDLGLR
ncbi:MAG: TonB-dependent receptor, partial [Chitinophagaceae bacterium]|nr:TonB-dependent receptor [Rubrivivax sp.]